MKDLKFNVPEMSGKTDFNIAVEATDVQGMYDTEDENDSIWEMDESDNFKTFTLGYTDLMVDSDLEVINGSDYIAVNISNYSYMDSGVNVKLLADTEDGPILYEDDIENIKAGTTRILKFKIQDIAAGADLNRIVTIIRPTCDELITENNKTSLYVNDRINRYRLNVEAGTGGHVEQVSGSYKAGDPIRLKADAFAGYQFVKWNCSVDGVIDDITNPETTIYMPTQNIEIQAEFAVAEGETFKLDRQAGEGGTITGSASGRYAEGIRICLKAVANTGYRFAKWVCDRAGLISNVYSNEISFSMPDENVTVKAEFEKTPGTSGGHSSHDSDDASENESIPNNLITDASELSGGTWSKNALGWQLKKANGKNARRQWALVNEKWYAFDEAGYMLTGWQLVNGRWYYLDPVNGHMLNGWQKVGGYWYYLDKTGGAMLTGWQNLNGQWYYFNSKKGHMITGWILDNGSWYYLEKASGSSEGSMLTGWQMIDEKWYYLNPSSNGKLGAKSIDTWIGNYYVDPDGVWKNK